MKAAVYARVSGSEQALHGTSLETQVAECRAHIEQQGWELAEPECEFVDAGVSGKLKTRPQLDEMMRCVAARRIDVVVVSSLSRLGRSSRHLHALLGELDDSGCEVVFLAEQVDTTPAGRLLRDVLISVSELEHSSIRERTTTGRIAAASSGGWNGGRIGYGLRRADGEVVLDPTQAAVISRIYELFVTDALSPHKVAAILNAEGHRSPSGKRWATDALRSWIQDATHLNGSLKFRLAGEEFAVPVPKILTDEQHDALREAVRRRSGKRPPVVASFPLTGRITSACGCERVHGLSRGDRGDREASRSYQCAASRPRNAGETRCDCRPVSAEVLEQKVWQIAKSFLSSPERLEQLVATEISNATEEQANIGDSASALARKIARLEKSTGERVGGLFASGMDASVVKVAVASMERDLATLRERYEKVRSWEKISGDHARAVSRLEATAQMTVGHLESPSPAMRSAVLEALDLRVEILSHDTCHVCNGARLAGFGKGRCSECCGKGSIPVVAIRGILPSPSSSGAEDTGDVIWSATG